VGREFRSEINVPILPVEYQKLCIAGGLTGMPPVDECSLMPDICGDGVCVDTDDGYSCDCFNGFTNTGGSEKCYGKESTDDENFV